MQECERFVEQNGCRNPFRPLSDDLELGAKLDTAQYRRVRYEDLVADPMHVMESLYAWLGIPVSSDMQHKVYLHFHAEEAWKGRVNDTKLYSTFRTSNYSRLDSLPSSVADQLQEHCTDVFRLANYSEQE